MHPHEAAVDAETGKRAEQMLHHFHAATSRTEIRATRGLHAIVHRSGNHHLLRQILPHKHHPGAGGRGLEFDAILTPTPVADARNGDRPLERALRPLSCGLMHEKTRGNSVTDT